MDQEIQQKQKQTQQDLMSNAEPTAAASAASASSAAVPRIVAPEQIRLGDNIHFVLKKNVNQGGGNSQELFDDINSVDNNDYIESTDGRIKYIFKNNQNKHKKIHYFDKGISSIVFTIEKENDPQKYVLKISKDEFPKDKYISDSNISQIIQKSLPTIISYGKLLYKTVKQLLPNSDQALNKLYSGPNSHDNFNACYYYISPEYKDHKFLIAMSDEQKYDFTIKLLQLLENVGDKKYFIDDLKIINIGTDDNSNIILIDYDKEMIRNQNNYLVKFKAPFIPYCMYKNIVNIENQYYYAIPFLDKFYAGGLAEILIKMFIKPHFHNASLTLSTHSEPSAKRPKDDTEFIASVDSDFKLPSQYSTEIDSIITSLSIRVDPDIKLDVLEIHKILEEINDDINASDIDNIYVDPILKILLNTNISTSGYCFNGLLSDTYDGIPSIKTIRLYFIEYIEQKKKPKESKMPGGSYINNWFNYCY